VEPVKHSQWEDARDCLAFPFKEVCLSRYLLHRVYWRLFVVEIKKGSLLCPEYSMNYIVHMLFSL